MFVEESSDIPFLKLFIPFATSPIKLEILPLPKSKTTITTTIAICQKLIPIFYDYIQLFRLNKYLYLSVSGAFLIASSISSYIFCFSLIDCSLKNFPVPNIDLSMLNVSIKPAEPNSSTVGKSDNF